MEEPKDWPEEIGECTCCELKDELSGLCSICDGCWFMEELKAGLKDGLKDGLNPCDPVLNP
ncbi:hypothetical protein D3C73_1407780 [compost metagenome]